MTVASDEAKIVRLHGRIRELETHIARLKEALRDDVAPFAGNGLTASEIAILGLLLRRQAVTRAAIMLWLYSDRLDEPDEKICDVFMCRLRKKIAAAYGIEIETLRGLGWRLPAPARARLRELAREGAA